MQLSITLTTRTVGSVAGSINIRRYKVDLCDTTLGSGRESVDYFLYSPGSLKELVIYNMDKAIDVAEGLVFYSLAKAKHLNKKLKISCSGYNPDKRHLKFFKNNGVLLN